MNRLGGVSNANTAQKQAVKRREESIDLTGNDDLQPRFDHGQHAKKRQKTHSSSTGHDSQGADMGQRRDERKLSTSRSSLSQSHNEFGNRGGPRSELGASSSANIRAIVGPAKVRRPRRESHIAVKGNHGSDAFSIPAVPPEDPNDVIIDSDGEGDHLQLKPRVESTFPSVEIPSNMQPSYQGTARLKPARPRPMYKQHSSEINARVPETSKYFSQKNDGQNDSKPKDGAPNRRRRLAQKAQEIEESDDDLSKDHYSKAPLRSKASVDKRNQVERDTYLDQANSGKRRQSQTEPSSDEDDEKKGQIIPTNFLKKEKISGQQRFQLIKAFTEKILWLVENRDVRWWLVLESDTQSLVILNPEGKEVWSSTVSRLDKLQHEEDGKKLVLHVQRQLDRDVGTRIHLEFGNIDEADALRTFLKSVKASVGQNKVDSGKLETVFGNTIMQARKVKERRKSLPEAEDIGLLTLNKAARDKKILDERLQRHLHAKQPGSDGRVASSMRTQTDVNASPQPRSLRSKPSIISAGSFYNKPPDSPLSTRSAARTSTRPIAPRPAPRSPTPPPKLERWSQQPHNANWQDDWKGSLIFPPGGKNKATVDMQDIERLDEGELLNDNLLVFYLRKLEYDLQTKNPDLAKRVYFQNPFFYERLTTNPPRGKKINYEAVQRWTAKVDLSKYDYIIVPVNESLHWYVAIICNVRKFFEPVSPEPSPPSSPDLLQLDSLADKAGHVNTTASPSRVLDELEEMSLKDCTPKTSKSRNCNGKSVDDAIQGTVGEAGPNPEDSIPSGEATSAAENEEAPIVSDLAPAQTSGSIAVSTDRQQKKKTPAVRHVNTDAPRIITLDSLGITRSATCTNLKSYLLAEIKAKTGKDVADPGRVGHTVKQIPQQDNYSDCGLFLLMYVEMFLAKGDDFIKDLIKGSQDLELQWPAASELRHNIRQLLFDLQKKQIIENERLREEKRKVKVARAGKAGSKPNEAKKPKTSLVTPEQPAKLPEDSTLKMSSKNDADLEVHDSTIISTADKHGTSATDAVSTGDPGNSTMAVDRDTNTAAGTEGGPSLQAKGSIARIQDIGSRLMKSLWNSSQGQHETIQAEDHSKLPEEIMDKYLEPRLAPKHIIGRNTQQQASSATIHEIPDSPTLLAKDDASSQQSGNQENKTSKAKARVNSPELGERQTTPGCYKSRSSHSPIDVDGDEEPAAAAPSKLSSNDASRADQEQEDPDEVMLLDPREPIQSSNGPENPQLLDSSPEMTTKHGKKGKVVPNPQSHSPFKNPTRSQRRTQVLSPPENRSSINRTPHSTSPASKKRKASAEVHDGKRPHPSFEPRDGADQAIIGLQRSITIVDRPATTGKSLLGGQYTRFTSSP